MKPPPPSAYLAFRVAIELSGPLNAGVTTFLSTIPAFLPDTSEATSGCSSMPLVVASCVAGSKCKSGSSEDDEFDVELACEFTCVVI